MPSMCSTVLSTAARRASVSRLPSPASTRRRVRPVSSNVMLPELPDASMETRKPIVHPSGNSLHSKILAAPKQILKMMAERCTRVNRDYAIATMIYSRGDHGKVRPHRGWFRPWRPAGCDSSGEVWQARRARREAGSDWRHGHQYRHDSEQDHPRGRPAPFRVSVSKHLRRQLSRNGIDVLTGTASFLDAHHMQVTSSRGQSELEAGYIVLATGTKPAVSPLVPFNDKTIINSDQILRMPEIPKSMIVVGGGVIGVEYVCMFATLGVRVTLIEKRPRLLEFADAEMVEALCYHLRDRRVTLRLNEEVESVEETPDHTVVANLKSKKKVTGDALLYAVGRQGNVDELNLAAGGLEADARGRIPVDENYQTKQPHVYAVGDVIGFPSLGSVSMEQGRIAAARAFGMPTNSNRANYPYGIYTIPEISFIGKTEEQLTEEGVPYEVGMAF